MIVDIYTTLARHCAHVRSIRNEAWKAHCAVLYDDGDSIFVSGPHTDNVKGCMECERETAQRPYKGRTPCQSLGDGRIGSRSWMYDSG